MMEHIWWWRDRHDRVIGYLNESIRGQRHEDQQTKTQFIDFKCGQDNGQGREPVKILGEELHRVHRFKYPSASVEETGGMTTEISQRVSAAWGNWKRCSGVLYNRRMPVNLKRNVYKTVVRPALLYGAETWATTRGQEARLEVNETRMQRWMCGETRRDKIRNVHIRVH